MIVTYRKVIYYTLFIPISALVIFFGLIFMLCGVVEHYSIRFEEWALED